MIKKLIKFLRNGKTVPLSHWETHSTKGHMSEFIQHDTPDKLPGIHPHTKIEVSFSDGSPNIIDRAETFNWRNVKAYRVLTIWELNMLPYKLPEGWTMGEKVFQPIGEPWANVPETVDIGPWGKDCHELRMGETWEQGGFSMRRTNPIHHSKPGVIDTGGRKRWTLELIDGELIVTNEGNT